MTLIRPKHQDPFNFVFIEFYLNTILDFLDHGGAFLAITAGATSVVPEETLVMYVPLEISNRWKR